MAEQQIDTVLVVEDDPGVLRLQQIRLERAGYVVRIATTAAEALEAIQDGAVDLMLLDQHLPGDTNGLELYAKIKEAGFNIPAILVTGFGGDNIVLQSFRAGVFDFVPKTNDYLEYLLPTIERVLKKRRTEFQLVESEARLSAIIRSALDAVLTVNEAGCIGVFNPAAEQMFGLTVATAQGRSIDDLLPAWDGWDGHRRTASTGPKPGQQFEHWETEAARASGERFPVELSVSWVETGRRQFWTLVIRDISERKKTQVERERFISEQAARKEAEAARARLELIAQKNVRLYQELRHVDRLKDEFLAMLSHELRNPLAAISNALELIRLEATNDSTMGDENWAIIERQIAHLVRLVNDLLDISRINQGKIRLQKEPIDLGVVVNRAVESSLPLIQARCHTLNTRMDPESLGMDGDLVRLVQVLSNLLQNAAKYTPEGGKIELLVEKEGVEAVIRVRDNGMGIPAEMIPRLFEPFSQSERTLDRSDGGLGIGLALVRRLTEMHGGKVAVVSGGPEQGSEFTVRLPLTDSSALVPEPPRPQTPVPTVRRRILVVDDNQDSARSLLRLLETMGHEVAAIHDGPSTFAKAQEFNPEIILLDIGLPGMDGYEVARQLRARKQYDRTVLVALTGYGSPEDRRQSLEAGINAHLVKPVDLTSLRSVLAQPLDLLGEAKP